MLANIALALLPLASAAPAPLSARGGNTLSCVNQMYTGAFTSTGTSLTQSRRLDLIPGLNGYIHLYGNVTWQDPDTNELHFNETRLGIAEDGTLQDCGDCRSTQQFGFEVCQGPDRKALEGL